MAKLLGIPKGIGMGPTRRSYNLLERGPIKSARQKFATNVAIAPQFSKATKLPPDKSQTSRSLDALLARTDEAGNAQYPALHLPACARSASGRNSGTARGCRPGRRAKARLRILKTSCWSPVRPVLAKQRLHRAGYAMTSRSNGANSRASDVGFMRGLAG